MSKSKIFFSIVSVFLVSPFFSHGSSTKEACQSNEVDIVCYDRAVKKSNSFTTNFYDIDSRFLIGLNKIESKTPTVFLTSKNENSYFIYSEYLLIYPVIDNVKKGIQSASFSVFVKYDKDTKRKIVDIDSIRILSGFTPFSSTENGEESEMEE